MKEFILKSMTDFVLQNSKEPYVEGTKYKDIVSYANFLKKPLKLGYFIPCDENDVPLEKPKNFSPDFEDEFNSVDRDSRCYAWYNDCKKYQEAKQRVLFEGFEYDGLYIEYKINNLNRFFKDELRKGTIEDLLIQIDDKIKLTETAKKEIGYETT